MARAIFLALTLAMASGARYDDDYSGVKMLQYGSAADYDGPRDVHSAPADDYREHSHDAPIPLDYKNDDEPRSKSKTVGSIEEVDRDFERSESWHETEKEIKPKRPTQTADDTVIDHLDKHNPDEIVPKFKSSNRISRHRSRLKDQKGLEREDDGETHSFLIKHSRNKIDRNNRAIVPDDSYRHHQGSVRENHNAHYDADEISTTTRKARRKPRDRFVKHVEREDAEEDDYQKLINEPHRLNPDQMPARMSGNRERGTGELYDPPFPELGESIDSLKQKFDKTKPKDYQHYDDYYDMKRVQNIRNKLPSLLRRPTLKAPRVPTPTTMAPSASNLLWQNRRLVPWPSTVTLRSTNLVMTMRKTTTTTMTTTRSTATSTTQITTTTQRPTTVQPVEPPTQHEMSLAEKSRLSILRKALRKETRYNETSTKKPPVLLLVTGKMQTIVIVEPGASETPIMRVREVEVSNDSPQQLDMVKRMMRHKLVASAKNIHELTDNWDELVCDYIDTALLENSSSVMNCSFILSGLCVWISVIFTL